MKVYLSGKITGDEHYKEKFLKKEKELADLGFSVMNPASLNNYPEFTWDDYLKICFSMIEVCDAIFVIDGKDDSRGVKEEIAYSQSLNKRLFFNKISDIE